jgi:simple sugar transport system ATP-binding protein
MGIVRRYGAVLALDGADLDVRAGEVHAVLGENGAGKSTLLGILGGMLRPDAGTVEIQGDVVQLRSPRDAWARGVGLVHQHFTLVPALSVLENLALGWRGGGGLRLPYDQVADAAARLAERTGLRVPLDARVEQLGVGERQRVEILKTLLRDPPLLVLDEPTAVLTPGEADTLFALLRDLAATGRAVVLVAHKIDEVLRVADRVTVLRHGRTVLTAPRTEVDESALVLAMVGESLADPAAVGGVGLGPRARGGGASQVDSEGPPVVELSAVGARGDAGRPALVGVSLAVRRGEIVGVAGVEGNGQRELALVLAGRRPPHQGVARLPGGIGFIPQDRSREGLIGDFDLVENMALALHDDDRFTRRALLRWAAIRERAEAVRVRFGIRAPDVRMKARALSGGNQQRLVVGRELALAADLLVAANPTRGLDVTAAAFVHAELIRLVREPGGPGVVLISTDLDEVLALSDRVLVMTRGLLVATRSTHPTREEIGGLMLGSAHEVA